MLDEIIRELTTKNNDMQTKSEGVLAWAKRIEVQRALAVILNDIMEMHQFDKIKVSMCKGSAQLMERHAPDAGRQVISRRCARAKESKPCMSWK